ncbi:MAG: hypothetical protein ACFFDP_02040 [Promethearchaeota archaeon]
MKLGEILSELVEKRLSRYGLKYPPPVDTFLDAFLPSGEIKQVSIKSILVLTDHRPRSLVAIAYAFRLAKAFKASLIAITKGMHQELIQEEAKRYNISLSSMITSKEALSVNRVQEVIHNNKISLVIIHNMYESAKAIIESSSVPVLVVKVGSFVRSLK